MTFMKHSLIALLILFIAGCLAWWAVVLSGRADVAADGSHWPVTERLLVTARENAVARQASDIEARLPALDEDRALYEAVIGFEDMCAACHTPPGGSPTALAQGLNPPAPDLAESAGRLSPAELFWVTKHGIRMSGMPAWGPTHDDADLWPVVALINAFPEFGEDDYQRLVAAAHEAGIEHHHHHDDGHAHDHGHAHHAGHHHDSESDHEHEHEHGHDHDQPEQHEHHHLDDSEEPHEHDH